MNYIKFTIKTEEAHKDILIALLSQYTFEAFEETDGGFFTYIPENELTEEVIKGMEELQNRFPYTKQKELIQPQNWNKVWEESFQPIIIGDFCAVRASFHQIMAGVAHEIVIDPKMAFGTGHHETTYMVVNSMKDINFTAHKVLDYGCGTGILAILAEKLGATHTDALDIDPAACENAKENTKLNNSQHIDIHQGVLDNIQDVDYDVILANINRNVILASLSTLYDKLKTGGTLVVSGILSKDRAMLDTAIKEAGFSIQNVYSRSGWVCEIVTK